MSHAAVLYTSPLTAKKTTTPNGYRSRVRETARKYETMEKTNTLPPSPALSHHSSVSIQVNGNNTEKNERSPSTSSSSSDSIPDEPATVERKKPEKTMPDLSKESVLLTKPHISTARIEIRPPTQRRPTPAVRKLPRPTSMDDEEPTYINHVDSFDENKFVNGHDNFHEIDDENEIDESSSGKLMSNRKLSHASKYSRNGIDKTSRYKNSDAESLDESTPRFQRKITINSGHPDDHRALSFSSNYQTTEPPERLRTFSTPSSTPPPPTSARPFVQHQQPIHQDEFQPYTPKRSLPMANLMMELGALLVVFLISMTLALAVRDDETKLRTTMQIVFSYIYLVSIIWMVWCTFDIIKFRREWSDLTCDAKNQEDYMTMTEQHSQKMFYFPDIHNTGGLFMRVGAGIFCMGSLILTVLVFVITIIKLGSDDKGTRAAAGGVSTTATLITQLITYLLRIIFHCLQYSFIFRYGNLVINHYRPIARIGLIHLIIANFCTWFESIVIETLEQIDNDHSSSTTTTTTTIDPMNSTYPITTDINFYFTKLLAAPDPNTPTTNNKTILETLYSLEHSLAVYLYPCLIEYSLIALTVFFIMWKNIGKDEKRSGLHFGDRHVFTVNCSRASRGLLIGGIIFLLTIVTLIPTYLFEDYTTTVTQLTAFILLIVSLLTVCLAYFHTTKLYYDQHAHVDIFDQALILITTFGDFAYAFFGLYASLFLLKSQNRLPVGIEIASGFLAIIQTFLQSNFILDTLKRRTTTKQEQRNKPGRETITALLLMNLALWIHDSVSAKKVQLNPSQMTYYNADTWAIIQAFSSPLSIFYRFHSSVCLADIWQEVYQNDPTRTGGTHSMIPLVNMNSGHDS